MRKVLVGAIGAAVAFVVTPAQAQEPVAIWKDLTTATTRDEVIDRFFSDTFEAKWTPEKVAKQRAKMLDGSCWSYCPRTDRSGDTLFRDPFKLSADCSVEMNFIFDKTNHLTGVKFKENYGENEAVTQQCRDAMRANLITKYGDPVEGSSQVGGSMVVGRGVLGPQLMKNPLNPGYTQNYLSWQKSGLSIRYKSNGPINANYEVEIRAVSQGSLL